MAVSATALPVAPPIPLESPPGAKGYIDDCLGFFPAITSPNVASTDQPLMPDHTNSDPAPMAAKATPFILAICYVGLIRARHWHNIVIINLICATLRLRHLPSTRMSHDRMTCVQFHCNNRSSTKNTDICILGKQRQCSHASQSRIT